MLRVTKPVPENFRDEFLRLFGSVPLLRQRPQEEPGKRRQDQQKGVQKIIKSLTYPGPVGQHPYQRPGADEQQPETERLQRQDTRPVG